MIRTQSRSHKKQKLTQLNCALVKVKMSTVKHKRSFASHKLSQRTTQHILYRAAITIIAEYNVHQTNVCVCKPLSPLSNKGCVKVRKTRRIWAFRVWTTRQHHTTISSNKLRAIVINKKFNFRTRLAAANDVTYQPHRAHHPLTTHSAPTQIDFVLSTRSGNKKLMRIICSACPMNIHNTYSSLTHHQALARQK